MDGSRSSRWRDAGIASTVGLVRAPTLIAALLVACRAGGELEQGTVDTAPRDADGDGWAADDDCDDQDASVGGASTWYADADGDGYGDPDTGVDACEAPEGTVADATDCDDGDGDVHPGAAELPGDALDSDCDGVEVCYGDADGDGYAGPETVRSEDSDCEDEGELDASAPSGDCDDGDDTVHPGADDVCNGVDDDCDGEVDGALAVPDQVPDIASAIEAAADGDHICVAAGTWNETIDFAGKNISIVSVEGSASTTLDGGGSGPVVTLASGESDAYLEGFTITGGDAGAGAGVYLSNVTATLTDVRVTGNVCSPGTATDGTCAGVGLYAAGSMVTLADSVVSENAGEPAESWLGYAALYGAGLYLEGGTVVLEDVAVSGNSSSSGTARTGQIYGVGMSVWSSELALTDVTITGQTVDPGDADVTANGIGLYSSGSTLAADRLVVADNEAIGLQASDGPKGGGLFLTYTSAVITNGMITGNALDYDALTTTTSSRAAAGGGLYLGYDTRLDLVNASVVGNTIDGDLAWGGGLYAAGYSGRPASPSLTNVVFAFNEAASGGGALAANSSDGDLVAWVAAYCDFADNGDDAFLNLSSPVGTDGNIDNDPGFTDTSGAASLGWDLRLDSTSALIDAGDPTINDSDGTTSDIGAYGGPGSW